MRERFNEATLARIEAARRETVARLASRARHLTVERDELTAGWIVRNPRIPGTIELVNEDGACSCRSFQVWGRCKHAALVEARDDRG